MVKSDEISIAIFELLSQREVGKSICPSEIARRIAPDDWRPLMPEIRSVAYNLQDEGRLVVTQQGATVERDAKGPIRLSLPPNKTIREPNE